ncbi:MAG: nucleotidyltransferase domain-containing protein [Armatimonadota bacterium]
MSTTQATDDVLGVMIERIVSRFHPEKIILFGSRARGEAHGESDIDLLVVMPTCDDQKAATIAVLRSLADLPVSKDILVTSTQELETRGKLASTVLHAALREGEVVYAR